MSFLVRFRFSLCAVAAMSLLALGGCAPPDSSQSEDEKEPHYVLGKSRVNAMDYTGAIEAFSESLEVNPHSAPAHFQLAMLFENQAANPASAIYHYQEYLRLNPKADNADVVRQRIYTCKQQLAADVLPLPSTPFAQRQLEDLAEKNRRLQEEVDKWRAYYNSQQNPPRNNPPPPQPNFTGNPTPGGAPAPNDVASQGSGGAGSSPSHAKPAPPVKQRTYVVVAGDTFASIARKAGVSLAAMQAANPGVSPKKLKPGQTLNIPVQ
jgi:tetratricopeptide (TPR) repeat protein